MTKQEHISYWLKSADNDFDTAQYLFDGGRYLYALFFGHLYLEKICKALWVKNNSENYPPKIHNLITLVQQANIELSESDLEFMAIINRYQLSARYPDYVQTMMKEVTKSSAEETISRVKTIAQCLKEKLQ